MCMDAPNPGNANAVATSCAQTPVSGTCTVSCAAGYSGSQVYTCGAAGNSQWNGADLVCTANACASLPDSGAGFGAQCSGLVTGATCTQLCAAGYSVWNGESGVMTCSAGTLDTANQITCAGMLPVHSAGCPSKAIIIQGQGWDCAQQCSLADGHHHRFGCGGGRIHSVPWNPDTCVTTASYRSDAHDEGGCGP